MFLDELGNVCETLPDKTIHLSGDKLFITFKSIFEQCGLGNAGYAPKAARDSLIQSGCIELVTGNKIKFLSKIPKEATLNSDNDSIRQISNTIHRYISTQFKNREATQNNMPVMMEKSMMSDSIPDEKIDICFDQLKNKFTPPFVQGKGVLESHESNSSHSNYAVGYQVFFFKTEL